MTSPGHTAAIDQALALARDVVEPTGGELLDLRDSLLTIVVRPDGRCQILPGPSTCTDIVVDYLEQLLDAAMHTAHVYPCPDRAAHHKDR